MQRRSLLLVAPGLFACGGPAASPALDVPRSPQPVVSVPATASPAPLHADLPPTTRTPAPSPPADANTLDALSPKGAPSTAANLVLAARHDGFKDAWLVGDKLVLVGCHRLRVLEAAADVKKGHDVVAPDVSDERCTPQVVGVSDGALVLQGSERRAVDVGTGKLRAAPAAPAAETDAREVFGATYAVDDAGVVRLERHRHAGFEVWPVAAGRDSLFAYGPDGLVRAADPATDRVVWEYGTGLLIQGDEPDARPPIVWDRNGVEVVAVRSRSVTRQDRILLFGHGATATPLWTGKVRGRAKAGKMSLESTRVHAGGHTALLDAKSAYELSVSTRGTLLVAADKCADNCDVASQAVDVDPRHGDYTLDLEVTFSQACR